MKLILSLALLLGSVALASAGTTNIYLEDWGTGKTGVTGDGNINTVGWTGVSVSQTAGPYLGIYSATGANDPASGAVLDANTVYFTTLSPNQTTPGMFYTTDASGPGGGGNSSFSDINPSQYTNLALSVEVMGGPNDTNYFAVRVGSQWYVSTTQLAPSTGLTYPQFTNDVLPYTNAASAWRTLTINATDVTIGSTPGANLSGSITGIGIVELPTANGFNYNQLAITAFAPNAPPPTPASITAPAINQTTYSGGGASFLILTAGTPPLTYIWMTNGVQIHDGSKYSGTGSNLLTISNTTSGDAAVAYSVIVTNVGGSDTNSGLALTVNPFPSDYLYAETFPYVGPNGNLPLNGVGWQGLFQGSTGIYSSGPGIGNVFSYSGVAVTNLYYTTDTNDLGQSGVAFDDINPANYANVTLQAYFTPGNGAALNPTNVVAYWAVQMQGGNWYSSVKPVPVQTISQNNYQLYQLAFTTAASNWNTLTLNASSVTIGGKAASALTGHITGAGIVIAHLGLNGGGDFNFNNFAITTDALTVLAPTIGQSGAPYSQSAPTGGGVSFGVATSAGQPPFTYGWTLNGVTLKNGGRISGADTPTLTIADLTSADSGTVVAFVTNAVGVDESDFYVGTSLTVTNADVGVLYSESFPFVGPLSGNYPISSVGWVEAVPSAPNALYERIGSDAAVFAYLGSPATTAYYTTSATDTNQAGLPFPNIGLAYYPDLSISVDIAPSFASSNVTAYLAVQLNRSTWYVSASALPVPTASDSSTFSTYTTPFNPAAANWKNLTITSSGALVGGAASSNLKGIMTGAGLVFVTVGSGGTFNFDNFSINATGLGGINVGAATGGNVPLSWVGNPAVNLQSTTSLATRVWRDVPNSAGLYSTNVAASGGQKYFRLVQH